MGVPQVLGDPGADIVLGELGLSPRLAASSSWSRSSISFWTSCSADRVGFQSMRSAPEPG
jgi:hypothetical protein